MIGSSHGEYYMIQGLSGRSLSHFSESCVKGHRSSSCKHTDRPLFEIKKKGRPVSQCEKCRELRQSKRVHSKCLCNPMDEDNAGSSSSRKKSGSLHAGERILSVLKTRSSWQIYSRYTFLAQWNLRCCIHF